ncbi:hypothetical protein BKA61DRAFT_672240 [Leptodontidium sp. MPI-SDFR-AT-0119]|nr:hypothetical protein BKA61DRAFT_672240 [Leptodontidium sp. MPI-SDFR-AT-0119]
MHHPLLTIKSERVGIVPPPPGVTPNFTNPESRGYLIVIASIVLLVLSTTVLLLRLYSRRFLVHAVNFSDYAVVVGQISGFGFSAITLHYVANHTLGVHSWDIRISDLTLIMQLAVAQYAFLWLAIMFAKISILLFYLQLSPYRFFRAIIYGLLAITLAYSLLGAFAFLIVCRPIKKYWELTLPYGSCIDQREIWLATAAINSATDIIMVFLPVFLMWNVPIPKRTKIGVSALLMTGVFVTATSFIRLQTLVSLSHSGDLSWPVAPAIWA